MVPMIPYYIIILIPAVTNMPHKEYFEVRDNELDAQKIVNNSNYFIYMAHARHKFISELGIDFVEMAKNNQNLYLISSNIQFKLPLKSGEKFCVESEIKLEGKIKFSFEQKIIKDDGSLIATGYNICVCIDENNKKRPYIPEQILVNINVS
jgi:acyl-CoA thioester hydrolase